MRLQCACAPRRRCSSASRVRVAVNGGARRGRAWEQGGVRYLQRAASTPATRLEVVALQERLDRALQERQVPRPPRKGVG